MTAEIETRVAETRLSGSVPTSRLNRIGAAGEVPPFAVPGLRTPVRGAFLLADQARTPIPISEGTRGQGRVLSRSAPDPACSVVALDFHRAPEVGPA
jgi:hypothetical protein